MELKVKRIKICMVMILKRFTFTYNTPKLFNYTLLIKITWFKNVNIL